LGSAPYAAAGVHSAPPEPLAGFQALGRGRENGGKGGEGKKSGGEERGRAKVDSWSLGGSTPLCKLNFEPNPAFLISVKI